MFFNLLGLASMKGNLESDIESDETALEGANSFSTYSEGKKILTRSCSALTKFDELSGQGGEKSTSFVPKPGHPTCENVVIVIEKNSAIDYRGLLDFPQRGYSKETLSKPNSNKHSKPPRPPKGPSLSASDMSFVKEILKLAAKKRARIERMRALRKKAAKASSSSSNITAMVVTLLFFIVMLLQVSGLTGSPLLP